MPAAAVSLIGTAYSADQASNSADKASAYMSEATAQRQEFFDIGQEQLAPYREVGEESLAKMKSVFLDGNMDEFYESADYRFNLEQGEEALARKQSAAGSRYGGAALKEATQYAQGVASNEYNNFFNRLNSMSNMGLNAVNTGVNAGQNTAAGMASDSTNQANLSMERGQSMNQAVQGGLSNYTTLSTYNDLTKSLQPTTKTVTGTFGD